MKVKVLLLAVFAFVAMNVKGQDLKFGAKAGLGISNMGGDADAKSKIGFHFGGFAQYGISENMLIQPEVLFSFEGAKSKSDDKSINMTYLNIPIMVVYKIGAVQGLSIEAGPQLGFLLGAKYDGNDVKDSFKGTNFSLDLGAGYAINDNISAGIRYCIGLSDINDIGLGGSITESNFMISLAYKF